MMNYKLSLATKTLTVSKAFEDAVAKGKGEEYNLYKKLMKDIPDLKVVRKTHKTPSKYKTKSGETYTCNQYKNLTYERMASFINYLPDSDKYMEEFNFLKDVASSLQINRYKLVREWFVKQFPSYRTNPLMYINEPPKVVKATEMIESNSTEKKIA